MDRQDAVATILALIIFTGILFCPSPTPASLNGTEPDTVSPWSPQPAAAGNLFSLLTGVEDRLLTGHPLSLTPVPLQEVAENTTIPGGNETAGQTENKTPVVPDYDDDDLISLVENKSVSLMLLSMQNSHALYTWDEMSVKESAAPLQAFSTEVLADLTPLNVSNDLEEVKSVFGCALESYAAAGRMVQGDAPLNRTQVDTALEKNHQGSLHLSAAFAGLHPPVLHIPGEIVEVDLSALQSRVAPPRGEGELVLLQRYIYEDRGRANDISLMLESAEEVSAYYLLDGSGEAVVTAPGRTFLLVKVRATNLGHKGDNRVYKIRTPGINAFTLHCRETTYSPVNLVPGTSLGEPYGAATLDRYERKVGYIVFDVPEALNLDDCYVRVEIDGEDSPTWALGKTL